MPLLAGRGLSAASAAPPQGRRAGGLTSICSHPGCSSGWLRLWRSRQAPVFEGGWLCSPECARARIRAAVMRELQGHGEPPVAHRHRVPLGLILLSQGAISPAQLRAALARQRTAGGRLGRWLECEHGIDPRSITRGLGTQWGCPVLSLANHSLDQSAPLAPRLLLDAFGFLPLRQPGAALVYVGFEDRVDRCVSFAVERMTGLRVEAGLIDGREFASAHRRLLAAPFPAARMVEAAGAEALAETFAQRFEQARPVEARLVRMHDYFWLRLWSQVKRDGEARAPRELAGERFEDLLGSLAEGGA